MPIFTVEAPLLETVKSPFFFVSADKGRSSTVEAGSSGLKALEQHKNETALSNGHVGTNRIIFK
jgi:hypothetical protein